MALFTNAIAGVWRQLARIDNRAWKRLSEMGFGGSVTAFTRNGRKRGLTKSVFGAWYEICAVGVAEYASLGDRVSEIENPFRLIARSYIPNSCLRIIGRGRLKEERRYRNEVTESHFARSDGVSNWIFRGQSFRYHTMEHGAIGSMANLDFGIGSRVTDPSIRLPSSGAYRVRHGVLVISLHFAWMTSGARAIIGSQQQTEEGAICKYSKHCPVIQKGSGCPLPFLISCGLALRNQYAPQTASVAYSCRRRCW